MADINITQEVREVNITIEQSGQSYTLQPVLVVGGAAATVPSLQEVTDVGNDTTNDIQLNQGSKVLLSRIAGAEIYEVYNNFGAFLVKLQGANNYFQYLQAIGSIGTYINNISALIKRTNITANREYELPNKNGTFALLDDVNPNGTTTYQTLTGAVSINVETLADDTYFLLTGNTTITYTNTPAEGESFIRSFIIKSTTTESLTLPLADISKGTFANDESENQITIKFSNFPTEGLKIVQFINPA